MPAPQTRAEAKTTENTSPKPERPFEHGFETLGDPKLGALLGGAVAFVAVMDSGAEPHWLSLLGSSGCGKTHLAKAIHAWTHKHQRLYGRYFGNRGPVTAERDVMFVDCHKLATVARQGGWNDIDRMADAYLLVLDDLGAVYDPSGFVADLYMRILNQRLGKWTVVTSNLTAKQIGEKIDSRIASRMFRGGSVVIESTAGDWCLR